MSFAIVQHKSGVFGNTVPSNVTLDSAPTAGNLLVCFLGVNIVPSSFTPGTGWQIFALAQSESAGSAYTIGLFRYAVSGDTATVPNFASSGSTYWTACVYEISGVSGDWNTDCAFVSTDYGTGTTAKPGTGITPEADCLALTGFAQYNGNNNPTVSSGWTLDESQNNSSNYGSLGGAHQAFSGQYSNVSATWTSTRSERYGAVTLILATAQPTRPMVRQTTVRSGNITPGSYKMDAPPITGNTIFAFVTWGNGSQVTPNINSAWNLVQTVLDSGGDPAMFLLVHTVAANEALPTRDSLPAIFTSGSAYTAIMLVEVGGDAAIQSTKAGWQHTSSLTTMTTDPDPTGDDYCLALLGFGNYNGSSEVAIPSGWESALSFANAGSYGSEAVFQQFPPVAGTDVTATITEPNPSDTCVYIQLIVGASSGVPTQMYVSQLGYEVWLDATASMEVSQIGFEVWAETKSTATIQQAFVEVWSITPSKVRVTQAQIELWRSVSATNTQYLMTTLGFEVWEGFEYVTPPTFKKAIIVIMGSGGST